MPVFFVCFPGGEGQKLIRGRATGQGTIFSVAELLTGYLKSQNPDLTGAQFHDVCLTGSVFAVFACRVLLQVVLTRR